MRRDFVFTARTRQGISLVETPFEVLTDLRQWVRAPLLIDTDSGQNILARLAEARTAVLVTADVDVPLDTLQVIGPPTEAIGDMKLQVSQDLAVDADLSFVIRPILADGRMRLVIWGLLAESDLRCAVAGPASFDADQGQNILAWLGDRDASQRIGEIVRQESHLFQ